VVHTAAQIVEYVSVPTLIAGTVGAAGMWSVKAWAGGRKCTWEREWAGKMIMVVVSQSTSLRPRRRRDIYFNLFHLFLRKRNIFITLRLG
jgi:hypothetical protein